MINVTPDLFFKAGALIKLYNDEVVKAQLPDSDEGENISRNEKLGILIAVGGPFIQTFVIPGLPDEQLEKVANIVTENLDRFRVVRRKAAELLDKAGEGADIIVNTLID